MKILQFAAVVALALGLTQVAYANHHEKDGTHCTRGSHVQDADANKDGTVSHDEFNSQHKKMADEMFTKMDTNKDGKIDQAERDGMKDKMGKKCNLKDRKMDGSVK
jgi:hypothetical protein